MVEDGAVVDIDVDAEGACVFVCFVCLIVLFVSFVCLFAEIASFVCSVCLFERLFCV